MDEQVDRQTLIKEYCNGMSIPRIITKYKLHKESQFNGKWVRMTKKEVEEYYKIDFHLERSKSLNRWLMKHWEGSIGAERAIASGVF